MAEQTVTPSSVKHPAKYSRALRPIIGELIRGHSCVVDQFGGVGGIHSIADEYGVPRSLAVEIEREWAEQWQSTQDRLTVCGDSGRLAAIVAASGFSPSVAAFSPDYGNRMADHHEAKDGSERNTYRHKLGRMPSDGATTVCHFQPGGKNGQYEDLHIRIWVQLAEVMLSDIGAGPLSERRVVCNVSDFLRTQSSRRRQPLSNWESHVEETAPGKHRVRCLTTDWHTSVARAVGFDLVSRIEVSTRRNRQGANRNVRVDSEAVLVFRPSPGIALRRSA